MSYITAHSHTEVPITVTPPQPMQRDSTTQFILAIAILIKSVALLIHTMKK
ncbi:MAG: hypothetical protein KME13_15815 [Myxacorys californica WJT36-NPBG1]|jgi:hypothetical protein|nr:hypothetical protein [Myxacorys californica WJT36-NPBG1]